LQKIAEAALAIKNAEQMRFTLIQPDTNAAKTKLEEARNILFAQPEKAGELALEAKKLAAESVERARSLDQMATIAVGALLLAGLAGFLYKKYREEEA